MTQRGMMRKLKVTSRRSREIYFIYRHHVEPRVKLYVPKEKSFPIRLKYIDVTRTTHTSLDVMLEKILMITGTWVEIVNCQIRGPESQDLLY